MTTATERETGEKQFKASKSYFNQIWGMLKKDNNICLMRGKGTFPTCDIYNNANDMLSAAKHNSWTDRQREIIFGYKTAHLKQQASERAALDAKKTAARRVDPVTGRTPKWAQSNAKGDTDFFENRTIGVGVYCGPLAGEMLFHVNALVRGGANLMVEIQRAVLIEMARILKEEHGMRLPHPRPEQPDEDQGEIHFQWDNCGENKNRREIMFNALLVELGYFAEVTMGFLI